MSWTWLGPLVVAALSAAGCAALSKAVRRETARLRLARAELRHVQSRLRGGRRAP